MIDKAEELFMKFVGGEITEEEMKDALTTGPIHVVIVEPGKRPYKTDISRDTEELDRLVGGEAEFRSLGQRYIMINNEHGLRLGLPMNRGVPGTFIICKNGPSDDLMSLTQSEAVEVITKYY